MLLINPLPVLYLQDAANCWNASSERQPAVFGCRAWAAIAGCRNYNREATSGILGTIRPVTVPLISLGHNAYLLQEYNSIASRST
jgi:hypothetical protein